MVSRSEGDISISLRTGTFLFRLDIYNQDPLTKGLNDRRRLLEVVSSIVLVTLDDDVGEHPIAEVGADVTDDQISAGV